MLDPKDATNKDFLQLTSAEEDIYQIVNKMTFSNENGIVQELIVNEQLELYIAILFFRQDRFTTLKFVK